MKANQQLRKAVAELVVAIDDDTTEQTIEQAIMQVLREYNGMHVYILAEIKNGTGFSRGATFVQIVG